jgi:hypothetical protein
MYKKYMKKKPKSKLLSIKSNNGQKITQTIFKGKNLIRERKNFTREEIQTICQELGKELNVKITRKMHVSLPFPRGWRSGGWSDLGQPVKLHSEKDYDLPDPKYYSNFVVFVQKSSKKSGGFSANNSCFFDSLSQLIPKEDLLWSSDLALKKELGLSRNNEIPIDLMPKIQERLPKYKLLITGDHIYTSSVISHQELKIQLINGHYSPLAQSKRVHGIASEEKIPMIYKKDSKDNYIVITPESYPKRYYLSQSEFEYHWKHPVSSPYILIAYDDEFPTFKQQLKNFIEKAEIYKQETNNKINFFKTGSNSKTILDLFYKCIKTICADNIEQDEAEWIINSKIGALIYGKPYVGEGYYYDVVSMYPSLQKSSKMLFPIKRGCFQYIAPEIFNQLTFYQYGIYKCKIEYDESKAKLFRWNSQGYYTHFDLNLAKILNLDITIDNTGPNALIYSRDKLISGNTLFGKYIDLVFPLKQKGIKDAKVLLNNLWGLLCQKNTLIHYLEPNKEFEFFDNSQITRIQPTSSTNLDSLQIKIINNLYAFCTNLARIGPFLLSRARLFIGSLLQSHYATIKRIHTDGFISSVKLDLQTGTNLGDLRYEGHYQKVIIKNSMQVQGELMK